MYLNYLYYLVSQRRQGIGMFSSNGLACFDITCNTQQASCYVEMLAALFTLLYFKSLPILGNSVKPITAGP